MKTTGFSTVLLVLALCPGGGVFQANAQHPASGSRDSNGSADRVLAISFANVLARGPGFSQAPSIFRADSRGPFFTTATVAASGNNPVSGSGTFGRLTKWVGFSGDSFIGDSTIFEDKLGRVGIGTDSPTSRLTVIGQVESTSGGFKFPDGSIQSTAGVANGLVVRSLNGLMGGLTLQAGPNITIAPSGSTLTISAENALTGVTHDATLSGSGTSGSPLGTAIPLTLAGSPPSLPTPKPVLTVLNTGGGDGIDATGGDGNLAGSNGVVGVGGGGGAGGDGGAGLIGGGGPSFGASKQGGDGILTLGGIGANGGADGLAGNFQGDVLVGGKLLVSGLKMFHIDHPLDPEHKYLNHAAIESSEVKDLYDGVVTTDANGDAIVKLPNWFEALNSDFRYQLTVVGTFAQAIVAEKIKGNRFAIKTSAPNVEVSWQVTGVRSDPASRKHSMEIEEAKPERERGYYLNPDAFGQPEEKGIEWARHPELMQQMKLMRQQAKERHDQQR